ncbi:serpin A3-4-like [Meleagris gallopavo]|uniref:serpin A3-4-like n=1 Tax=Meleagris gallopavo TaxID=9103 RepID=UPI0012ABEA2C|nr:serpin A3-4-like [Meleagris gallopavo]
MTRFHFYFLLLQIYRNMKLLLFLCLLVVGIHSNIYPYEPYHQVVRNQNQRGKENRNMPQQAVGSRVCQFACCFYKEISSHENSGNIFFSPLSISTAFAMLTLGARSDTLAQILRVLHFNPREISENEIHEGYRQLIQMVNRKNEGLQLNMGNVLFVLDRLKPQQRFLNNLREFYEGEIYPMNFKRSDQAQMKINDYVAERTNGKIKDLINNLDPLTELLLISYIYFNGKICISNSLISYIISSDQEKQNDSALYCDIMPESLILFLHFFSSNSVNLYLPKFTLHGRYNLKNILYKMGIMDLFTDKADLSGITGQPQHRISQAIHQAVVKVDETGTEAAAATGMEIVPMSVPVVIRMNRPFLLVITLRDNILFMGKIVNPLEKD